MTDKRNAVQDGGPTALGQSTGQLVLTGAAFAVLGAGLGWLLKSAAEWLVTLDWAPMQGPAELLTSIPDPGLTLATVTLGALLGLALILYGAWEELSAEVTPDHLTLTRKGSSTPYPARDIATVFIDSKHLVLLAHDGAELAREKTDLPPDRVATALTAHGYTWSPEDPHRHDFRPWVPETPGLPTGANALLKARSHTLKKDSDEAEARELRTELARLGVVVRDEKKRQYWRLTASAG
ncbi:hypothetical protein [Streptomyces sp. NPDC051561]|uniref:YqeB family protein n=1 Tax=Streptomyces sp. NPDC051561 TaxID=3365658 RepID=UPI00379F3E3C